jgi:hypothetical protein
MGIISFSAITILFNHGLAQIHTDKPEIALYRYATRSRVVHGSGDQAKHTNQRPILK